MVKLKYFNSVADVSQGMEKVQRRTLVKFEKGLGYTGQVIAYRYLLG
jgi:hypothetical protein